MHIAAGGRRGGPFESALGAQTAPCAAHGRPAGAPRTCASACCCKSTARDDAGAQGFEADVREKIISVAQETMASDRVKDFMAKTGALVYWQNAEDTNARIARDTETLGKINAMLE